MTLIDTHAHIYLDPFKEDLEEVIDGAKNAGISKIIMPNIDNDSVHAMLEVEKTYQDLCHSMIGLHPCSVDNNVDSELKKIEQRIGQHSFVGIGETGTDLYWDRTYFDQQVEALKVQIGWAKEYGLPIILHSRDSIDQTLKIIEENKDDRLTGIFHCFTGSVDQAKQIINLGFYLGIGGVLTFKNAKVKEILDQVSPESIVLETDSPYLAPMPFRGKRNEPAYLNFIAEELSIIYDLSLNRIAEITTQNAKKIFGIK